MSDHQEHTHDHKHDHDHESASEDPEQAYFRNALTSFDTYLAHHLQINQRRRMAYLVLPREHIKLLREIGYSEKLDAVDEAIRQNAEFLDCIVSSGANPFLDPDVLPEEPTVRSPSSSPDPTVPAKRAKQGQSAAAPQQDKVRSTFRMFVRDWAAEGEKERELCYKPILDALEAHFAHVPLEERKNLKVLNPGAGLARLPCEIAGQGFAAQGNEISAHMLIASNYILNENDAARAHKIYPSVHSYSNQPTTALHLLHSVEIPDRTPMDILNGTDRFSFAAGDFLEVYGGWQRDGSRRDGEDQEGQWAGVVTCFFIDVSRNIIKVLDTIHRLLRPDGVWINLGPLEWHHPAGSVDKETGEGSVELSLDEVRSLARRMGFDVKQEKMWRTSYSGALESMSIHEYEVAFWVATKSKT